MQKKHCIRSLGVRQEALSVVHKMRWRCKCHCILKCHYYGLWKVHIALSTCMQGQKTLSLSYNMHLFLPYLLNDSQTIRSTIHFSKPPFKAVFVSF